MSISVMRRARLITSVMAVAAAAVFSALVLVGCGEKEEDPPVNASLVCADGEAWMGTVQTGEGPLEAALVLKEGGSLEMAFKTTNGKYRLAGTGTWSTSGNNMTVIITMDVGANEGQPETTSGPYSISGNTLTMAGPGGTLTFTKGKATIES